MSELVIGVDARELLGAKTGVGRYLGELLRRWALRPDAGSPRFVLYSPEALTLPDITSQRIETRVLPGGRGTLWEQTTLRRAVNRDRPDVFFAPAYTAPLGLTMPVVVTIHDISFTAHPEWFRWREGTRRRFLTRHTARRARRILTDSHFSRTEIERYYGIAEDRISVIPPGVTQRRAMTRWPEPLVLYAGSVFNRRRLPDLISAFAGVTSSVPDARLVIVGDNRTWPRQDLAEVAAAYGVTDRVELRSYVSDAELDLLYGRAAVFAFLSEYEGFGLTPLEALSAAVPIVVLDTVVAREVYGGAATYVRRGDLVATTAALRHYLVARERTPAELETAATVLGRYSWDACAEATLACLETAR